MPMNCTFEPNCLCAASNIGISCTHGVHHVAQKFTSTGVPLEDCRLIGALPSSRLGRLNEGAACPPPPALPPVWPPPLVNNTAANTAPTRTTTTPATTVLPDTLVSRDVDRALHVRVHVTHEVELPGPRSREPVVDLL